jgi:UDP-3-O-[3-hydroxymyristoyl] glucosamine N-acyltransferase
MKLEELARRLGCELRGDGQVEIVGVAPIESAGPGDLTFVGNPRYTRFLASTKAGAVIVEPGVEELPYPTLRTRNPHLAFAQAVEAFHRPIASVPGVHPTAVVAASAQIGPGASIGPYAIIGEHAVIGADARIGPLVVIYPEAVIGDRFTAYAHVTIRERVRIGHDVIVHSGAVIGSDGFGYVAGADGQILKMAQIGDVILEDHVEIGANATIDRAAVGSTVIRRAAKIDNLVMIGHGCEVGESSMLAGQVGLAGSTRVGRGVLMGGQAGAAGHLTIGDGAQIAASAGVTNSVDAGATVAGYPAIDVRLWRRFAAAWTRLPELLRRVKRLERLAGIESGPTES